MPIIIDPAFVPPAPPSTVESADLRLAARSDPAHAGAFLKADFGEQVLRTNLFTNPVGYVSSQYNYWAGTGGAVTRSFVAGTDAVGRNDGFGRLTFTTKPTTGGGPTSSNGIPVTPGEERIGSLYLRPSVALIIAPQSWFYLNGASVGPGPAVPTVACPANEWTRVPIPLGVIPDGVNQTQFRWYVSGAGITAAGQTLDYCCGLHEEGSALGSFFYGGTPGDGILSNRWAGAVGGSVSEQFVPALDPLPEQVRFLRADGTPVRSGDPAWAPGGVALAYDHEAQLGQPTSWYAVPVFRDGAEGDPTDQVALELPEPSGVVEDVWLKSVLQPSLSKRALLVDLPTLGRAGRVSTSTIRGRRNPSASYDTRDGYRTSFSVLTSTVAEREALEALLDCGPLLFQTVSGVDLEDFYLLPGDVDWEWIGTARDPERLWTVEVVEVDRPATVDSPHVVPGLSWPDVEDGYDSWDAVEAQVPSWLALNGW